jgi:hypothetical protein
MTRPTADLEQLDSGALAIVHGGQSPPPAWPSELRAQLGGRQPTPAETNAFVTAAQLCVTSPGCPDVDHRLPLGNNYIFGSPGGPDMYAAASSPGFTLTPAQRASLARLRQNAGL